MDITEHTGDRRYVIRLKDTKRVVAVFRFWGDADDFIQTKHPYEDSPLYLELVKMHINEINWSI